MARQRMILLYDISARERGLVLGTSNKTEFMLGYGTLFGDMASAINPLGDLYKTQVWQLAAALGVPAGIVEKKRRRISGRGRPMRGVRLLVRRCGQAPLCDDRRTAERTGARSHGI